METESRLVPGLEKNLISHPPYAEGKTRPEEEPPRRPLAPALSGEWGSGGGALLRGPAPKYLMAPGRERQGCFPHQSGFRYVRLPQPWEGRVCFPG